MTACMVFTDQPAVHAHPLPSTPAAACSSNLEPETRELELAKLERSKPDNSRRPLPRSPRQPSKFSGVSSLTLFFPASFNEDVSIISYLGFKGEATNYKHGVVEFVYESQAQLKDHKTQSEQGATAGPGQF